MPESNGWSEYKLLVEKELSRANDRLDLVDKRLSKIERHLAVVQTKVYMASACVAIVFSGLVSLFIELF